jgi:alpha-glucosidase (family GH31 glycosyl hydrolase)
MNFPDYTNPEVREWWAGLFKELIAEIGVKGVWNDMNEPAVMEVPGKTFPMDVRHDYDGNPARTEKHTIFTERKWRALLMKASSNLRIQTAIYHHALGLFGCATVYFVLDGR